MLRIDQVKPIDTTGKFEFEGRFSVEIKYVPKRELRRILKSCEKTIWEKHQQKKELDQERLWQRMAEWIVSWDLTVGTLRGLLPVQVEGADDNEEVPCTHEFKMFLLENLYNFEGFVMDSATELAGWQEEHKKKANENLGNGRPGDSSRVA